MAKSERRNIRRPPGRADPHRQRTSRSDKVAGDCPGGLTRGDLERPDEPASLSSASFSEGGRLRQRLLALGALFRKMKVPRGLDACAFPGKPRP